MKKVLKTKLSRTKKLVRKVLSKNSIISHELLDTNQDTRMTEESMLKEELDSLKDQIANLKAAIISLQNETEQKEISIANLAREKEKIHLDLLKMKRTNASLTKQLEEERDFYLKEKEIYCMEMNECKKLKKQLSSSISGVAEKSLEEYESEIMKLKEALNQTLEANYNLSIKYLRMKNAKTCLKTDLHTIKLEHAKVESEFKKKIENVTSQLNVLINEKMLMPISPSNKKYLQLLKQNSCLTYENFCLQLELDTLNYKFDKFRMEQLKTETNSRLRYIHHNTSDKLTKKSSEKAQKSTFHHDIPEKLEPNNHDMPSCSRSYRMKSEVVEDFNCQSCSKHQINAEETTIKIYERQHHSDIPEIKIINEKKVREKKVKRNNKREQSETKGIVKAQTITKNVMQEENERKVSSGRLATLQVFDVHSLGSSDFVSVPHITRSWSSPDLHKKLDTL